MKSGDVFLEFSTEIQLRLASDNQLGGHILGGHLLARKIIYVSNRPLQLTDASKIPSSSCRPIREQKYIHNYESNESRVNDISVYYTREFTPL